MSEEAASGRGRAIGELKGSFMKLEREQILIGGVVLFALIFLLLALGELQRHQIRMPPDWRDRE